jgi:murein L,D-transpeptidase YafK
MRRVLIFVLIILISAVGIAVAWIRHTPWMASHFPDRSHAADSIRKTALYEQPLTGKVDSIVVIKKIREMQVYRNQKLVKIYRIALGDTPVGHKHFQGDEKTPEGLYQIDGKNPNSICHKNLGISYPNAADRAYAARNGKPAGGDIKIHGLPNGQGYIGKGHLLSDWTNGCVGITDEEIDELYQYTAVGVPVFILP